MKKIFMPLAAMAMAFGAMSAQAHGPAPAKHGGIVQSASDLGFELVGQPDGALLYIDDHGKPFATKGASGKLTVLNGADKAEVDLVPSGDNALQAKGAKLAAGSKAVAAVTLPTGKVVTVRFTVK
ncbi:hypothetical protein LRS03_08940 [Rhizobacter sp. J219]|uniref:hypothetical protein n=1 Tax=Rhizobacter sp. J219 TaxID=2898430 RepID=UPI002150899C|nr:hypothetical protein [Rhizobacter sp. J219]MCR5882974.1 hypothetical protein [Rhizobacter sp. J219]